MANHEYSRTELFEKYSFYTDNQEQLQSNAEQRVSQWKYATEIMYRPLPYEDLIDARTDKRWTLSTRQWLGEPTESCWWHGYDDNGQLQIMKHSTSGATLLLFHEERFIDVMCFSGYPMMTRYCPNGPRIDRVYECALWPHQYLWEDFHYEHGICVASEEGGAYEDSEGEWVECDWKKTYRYVSDAKGLVEAYRDLGYGQDGELRVYKRRGSKTPAKPQLPLLLAYCMKIESDDDEELSEAARNDAYGFEMTIDHDEPIDKVLFAPPRAVEEVLDYTNLANVPRTSVGVANVTTDADIAALVDAGVTWILVDARMHNASEQVHWATRAGLNVMLRIASQNQLTSALANESLPLASPQQLVLAINGSGAVAKRTVNALRKDAEKAGLTETRVVGEVAPEGLSKLNPDVHKLGLDGYLLLDSTFDSAISTLDKLAAQL